MANELRICRRTACRWPAVASLSIRYQTRQVWILHLAADRNPALWDVCPYHADTLTVPRGWECVDERVPAVPSTGLAGRDVARGPSRYAVLRADLPRLAAAYANATAADPGAAQSQPVPRRDLDPMPPGQLSMSLPLEPEDDGAAVVAIHLAGQRRARKSQ